MYTLFDGIYHNQLKPLTFTKPVSELRVGIFTIKEKWEKFLEQEVDVRTKDYLAPKFGSNNDRGGIGISASFMPNEGIIDAISHIGENQLIVCKGKLLAVNPMPSVDDNLEEYFSGFSKVEYNGEVNQIERPWDIFRINGDEIKSDFRFITEEKVEGGDGYANNFNKKEDIFIEEGARVSGAFLNAENGPIYIASGATVMEGSVIRGPFALCANAEVKMGTKIYGPTTIGPYCKVGGEVNNVVFQSYSNKGHDGFLGNSVIGEWCNLGADTNSSNLKNNYGKVKAFSYSENDFIDTDSQFLGLIMGDHSKTGINTMLNTGTVVGVCANIFDAGFPPKHIPSLSWGGAQGFEPFKMDKAIEVAQRMMERRKVEFTDADKTIFKEIAK